MIFVNNSYPYVARVMNPSEIEIQAKILTDRAGYAVEPDDRRSGLSWNRAIDSILSDDSPY